MVHVVSKRVAWWILALSKIKSEDLGICATKSVIKLLKSSPVVPFCSPILIRVFEKTIPSSERAAKREIFFPLGSTVRIANRPRSDRSLDFLMCKLKPDSSRKFFFLPPKVISNLLI